MKKVAPSSPPSPKTFHSAHASSSSGYRLKETRIYIDRKNCHPEQINFVIPSELEFVIPTNLKFVIPTEAGSPQGEPA
jgi:hypothetical protein